MLYCPSCSGTSASFPGWQNINPLGRPNPFSKFSLASG
jgi:hypothetical protein